VPATAEGDGTVPLEGWAYQRRLQRLAESGRYLHAEADLVEAFRPRRVLDAGCGTGRVAKELARRGIDVVGVDRSEAMLEVAQTDAPEVCFVHQDLAGPSLDAVVGLVDLVLLAGNVVLFLDPGTLEKVVANLATLLPSGGVLLAGFELGRSVSTDDYDRACRSARLELSMRWSTWERAPFDATSTYAVSVHRLQPSSSALDAASPTR
jgi:SAM-dependent methyltransferase